LNSKVKGAVLERCQVIDHVGECEYCGTWDYIQLHHAVGGNGRRLVHESKESVWGLCKSCHDHLHGMNGAEMNYTLKRWTQERYKEQGYCDEEIRDLMGGRLYV